MEKNRSLILDKILYTLGIIIVYALGRMIPLYGVDLELIPKVSFDTQTLITQSVTGDINQISILAVGIFPYMISNILVQMVVMCLKSENKAKISPVKINRYNISLMIVIATIQAFTRLDDIPFIYTENALILAKTVAVIELITGSLVIMWLSERNKKYGIGGQTILIFINILDNLRMNLIGHDLNKLVIPLLIAICGLIVMMYMENTEKRIPMQRIAIYSIYGDQNYLALKLNPIGIMPIMFAATFYMLPQLLAKFILIIEPDNTKATWFIDNATLSKPLGMCIYIAVLYLLTITFSYVMLSPRDITERNQKSGDSIVGIRAGRETRKYLNKSIWVLSIISATVMSLCVGVPMILQLRGMMDGSLTVIPTTVMMLTGLWCTLYQEARAVKSLDSYEPFI